jgi:hypothetical protein
VLFLDPIAEYPSIHLENVDRGRREQFVHGMVSKPKRDGKFQGSDCQNQGGVRTGTKKLSTRQEYMQITVD